MHSITHTLALACLLVVAGAAGTIDPNTVPAATRANWCHGQTTSCPLLCSQLPGESASTRANDCDPDTLNYHCVCQNGQSPNASQYSQTIPYYVCSEANNQCVAQCAGSSSCQSACRQNNPCGAQDPVRVNTTTSSTMSATNTAATKSGSTSTGAAGSVFTTFGGTLPTETASAKSAGTVAVDLGRIYGLGVVAASMFIGFAWML